MDQIRLENYDGRKAYFGTEKYSIIKYGKNRYALPVDVEIVAVHLSNNKTERSKIMDKFPILLVKNEDIKANQATASRIQPSNNLLEKILTWGIKE